MSSRVAGSSTKGSTKLSVKTMFLLDIDYSYRWYNIPITAILFYFMAYPFVFCVTILQSLFYEAMNISQGTEAELWHNFLIGLWLYLGFIVILILQFVLRIMIKNNRVIK